MKRTGWNIGLRLAGLILALGSVGAGNLRPADAAGSYTYDFEQDLKPWAAGTGSALSLDYSDNLCPFEIGTGMALLTVPVRVPGRTPDQYGGDTAYMGASFPANPGDTVTVDWAAKPEGSCDAACNAVIYVGTSSTDASIKWTAVKGMPSFYGWTRYRYVTAVPANSSTTLPAIYIALGVNRVGGPSYLNTALGIDCVRVTIQANATWTQPAVGATQH